MPRRTDISMAGLCRNRADEHQVPGARKALCHAYGGGSQYFSMWVVGTDRPERHS